MTAYYNEIDPYAAQWLRNLIAAGHIAPGDVDERSVEDVRPDDLRGYTQCHFFAGIGVWSYALRRAGWPDDRPVWTGSCPCQPFSAAGKGLGFADERHLWPSWFHLIGECRPAVVFGEQVASSPVDDWIDLVQADVESLDYALGCVPFPSAGVNAPHIRDRSYWMAYTDGRQRDGIAVVRGAEFDGQDAGRSKGGRESEPCGSVRRLADADDARSQGRGGMPERAAECAAGPSGVAGGMANAADLRLDGRRSSKAGNGRNAARLESERLRDARGAPSTGPADGFWRAADWLLCRDGKWRPVEPGTFPLVDGAPSRVGRLRAYGNAINAEAAIAWIETCIELI
ncbi:MAG: DNA cytosine methyltransferase [Burkholderia gladioli]